MDATADRDDHDQFHQGEPARTRGVGAPGHESGLQNVRRRAEALNGSVRIHGASPNGTVLEWVVPLQP